MFWLLVGYFGKVDLVKWIRTDYISDLDYRPSKKLQIANISLSKLILLWVKMTMGTAKWLFVPRSSPSVLNLSLSPPKIQSVFLWAPFKIGIQWQKNIPTESICLTANSHAALAAAGTAPNHHFLSAVNLKACSSGLESQGAIPRPLP